MTPEKEQYNSSVTRRNIAYFWTVASFILLSYIVYKWGDKLEILTLIIGLIGGTVIGTILGYYYQSTPNSKPGTTTTTSSPSIEKAENVTVNSPSSITSPDTDKLSENQ